MPRPRHLSLDLEHLPRPMNELEQAECRLMDAALRKLCIYIRDYFGRLSKGSLSNSRPTPPKYVDRCIPAQCIFCEMKTAQIKDDASTFWPGAE